MTDSKENLSKSESTSESKKENEVETLQKPKRGQSRAKIDRKTDTSSFRYDF